MKKNVRVVDNATFERVFDACMGWIDLFNKAQDILRELESRKVVPFDLYNQVHKICLIEELPHKYRKEIDE